MRFALKTFDQGKLDIILTLNVPIPDKEKKLS